MDLSLKNYLTEESEFIPLKFPETYSYVQSLDRKTVDLALTELLQEKQRLKRETPHQVIGIIEEKKKELEKKIKEKGFG